jgi:integrator complex subunit 6
MPNNGEISVNSQNPAIGSAMAQPVPTSPTGPPPPFPPPVSTPAATPIPVRPHNDLTEDISKILQSSLHNGSGGSSSINHNNNHSNDKRLYGDDSSLSNHKDDSAKSGDEKQNNRVRRKAKATNVTSSTTAVVATKANQHKHTNGLNNISADKILSNCLNLLNGDEDNNKTDESFKEEEVEKWRSENIETRLQAFKEIRKFGRDYRGLYEQLEKIKGTYDMRFDFVQMCIVEANRFRRKQMVNCIQEWWEAQTEGKNGEAMPKVKS